MTSNGNTAQKHLIQVLTKTHQNPAEAYAEAITTASSPEIAEIISRIFERLAPTTTKQTSEIITILNLKNEIEMLKTHNRRTAEDLQTITKLYKDTAHQLEQWKQGKPLDV